MEKRRADHLSGAAAALGMTSIAAQIILLREFVSVFQGNELVIGAVLATWMLLTGAGAFLGRFSRFVSAHRSVPSAALIAAGVLPSAAVLLLRCLRNVAFTPGSMTGILQALAAAFVVLAPFCILSGFLFTLFVHLISSRGGESTATLVYSRESLGSAAGGIIFNVALIAFLDTFQALILLWAIDCLAAFLVGRRERSAAAAAAGLVFLAAAAFPLAGRADLWTRRFLFPGQDIVCYRDTPYGNLTVTRQGEQLNFFENTMLMFSTNDAVANEEGVHYCMVQRTNPGRVLLIGGGISGTPGEILKYGVQGVDYVEINPWIIEIGRELTRSLDDGRITVISGDPRMYVRSTPARYDMALVNLPDPGTAQLNRFYTLEFFRELKRILNNDAVFSISLLPGTEYQGAEARTLSSILHATLRRVFAHVTVVPGGRNYFLASDGALDPGIVRLISRRAVNTVYVNRYYLDDRLIAGRSASILSTIDTTADVNTDFRPVCYYRQLAYWLSYFGFDPLPWLLGAGFTLALTLGRFSVIDAGIFCGGFAASSMEIVILIAFQVLCGSLFQMTGVVVAAFMAGLAAGALASPGLIRRPGPGSFIALQLTFAAVCFLIPSGLRWLQDADSSPLPAQIVLTITAFAAAILIGMEFAVAAHIRTGEPAHAASALYGLDLFGSALGALVASVYAIPLLGIMNVSVLAGCVSAGGALICLLGRRTIPTNQPETTGEKLH